jgi:hypothetical protein
MSDYGGKRLRGDPRYKTPEPAKAGQSFPPETLSSLRVTAKR